MSTDTRGAETVPFTITRPTPEATPASFASLGVPDSMAEGLRARSIESPFAIQIATIPEALSGRDVCGKAPTGSGKTLAFGIPLVARVGRGTPKHPKGLVLAPTRELAAQIAKELSLLGASAGLRVATFYGAVGFGPQLDALRRGVDIAVACPGRLTDLVDRRAVSLDQVEMVVIDEADRMADMGFLPVVRRLLDQVPARRQTLLFSATLDGDVDVLVRRYQQNPVRHELATPVESDDTRTHLFWRASSSERVKLTTELVGAHDTSIVFCRTKRGADRLSKQLDRSGIPSEALHGDRSQSQRDRALAAFRSGRVRVLVATDLAARGIHVDDVGCVVHFDVPADHKDYVHRSGRTGRAGSGGNVISLVGEDKVADVRRMQKLLGLAQGIQQPDVEALAGTISRMSSTSPRPRRRDPGLTGPETAPRTAGERSQRPPRHASGAASQRPGRRRRTGSGDWRQADSQQRRRAGSTSRSRSRQARSA